MARVERILIVVREDRAGRHERDTYAVLTDGERIVAPRGLGGIFSLGFGRPPPRDEMRVALEDGYRRDHASHGAESLQSLAAAVQDAGIAVDAAQLAALPLDVVFEDVDELPERAPRPELARLERQARIAAPIVGIVIGAIWPSMNRYRAWKRHTWRRRILGGFATWGVGNLLGEMKRRPRR